MSVDHTKRHAAEDARNEAVIRTRVLAEHEQQILERSHARHLRRMHPLMGTSNRPSDDFEGCVE